MVELLNQPLAVVILVLLMLIGKEVIMDFAFGGQKLTRQLAKEVNELKTALAIMQGSVSKLEMSVSNCKEHCPQHDILWGNLNSRLNSMDDNFKELFSKIDNLKERNREIFSGHN